MKNCSNKSRALWHNHSFVYTSWETEKTKTIYILEERYFYCFLTKKILPANRTVGVYRTGGIRRGFYIRLAAHGGVHTISTSVPRHKYLRVEFEMSTLRCRVTRDHRALHRAKSRRAIYIEKLYQSAHRSAIARRSLLIRLLAPKVTKLRRPNTEEGERSRENLWCTKPPTPIIWYEPLIKEKTKRLGL